ncbi:MAG: mechanosensitive ion channel family protein [Pseudomonadota bacterium]
MDRLFQSVIDEWNRLVEILPRLAIALLALAITMLIGRLVGRTVETIIQRSSLPKTHGSFFRKLVFWVFVFIGALIGMNVLGLQGLAAGLLTGGGVTAVVLGFAFREIGENFLAGFFLAFSRPFKIGDLIESGGLRGTVRSIELRYTHVRSSDGKDIFIPSSQLFKAPLINFTRDGLLRAAFTVGIDYGDDPLRATQLLLETLQAVDGVLAEPGPAVTLTGMLDAWVEIELMFWVNTFDKSRGLGTVRTAAMAAARQALLDNGFTLSADTTSNLAVGVRQPVAVTVHAATEQS